MDTTTTQPEWLRTTLREIGTRSGVILHGNVHDLVYDPQQRQEVHLSEYLLRCAAREHTQGFTLIGIWDQVDGLRFPNQRMLQRFQNALRQQLTGAAPAGGREYTLTNEPAAEAGQKTTPGLYPALGEVTAAVRTVMQGGLERLLLLMDWSQLDVTQPAAPDPAERAALLQLAKALQPMCSDTQASKLPAASFPRMQSRSCARARCNRFLIASTVWPIACAIRRQLSPP